MHIADEKSMISSAEDRGIAKGIAQTQKANALNLLKMKLGTPEQISQAIGLPLEDVLKLSESAN